MQPVYDPHTTRLSSSLAPKLFVGQVSRRSPRRCTITGGPAWQPGESESLTAQAQVPKRYGEEELRALFSTCGPVLDVTVIRCKRTLSHKGQCSQRLPLCTPPYASALRQAVPLCCSCVARTP